MKDIAKLLKKVNKLVFTSYSMYGSEMNWNYKGNGTTSVTVDENKIFFWDKILLDGYLYYDDKKMWILNGENLEFWHFRNNDYEKIFTFYKKENILSTNEYICDKDIYMGKAVINEDNVILMLEIKSDKKNEYIEYKYSYGD